MNTLTYVFGMAKSSLSIEKAGSRRNLELDVLRTLYFMNQLSEKGINAESFILVYDDKVRKTIEKNWIPKYKFKYPNQLNISTFDYFDDDTLMKIKAEKENNSQFKDCVADFSKGVTEIHLIEKIEAIYSVEKYKKVTEQHEKYVEGINWDYFEIFEEKK